MNQPIYVFGAGGLTADFTAMIDEVPDIVGSDGNRYDIQAFTETSPSSSTFMDKPVISEERFRGIAGSNAQTHLFVLVGSPTDRERLVASLAHLQITYPSFAHPSVNVHRTDSRADGVIVGQNVVISANVRIERHAYINIGGIVGHDVTIREFASIGPGACLNGNVEIRRACDIGATAAFRPGVTVGDESVIGMGAVVVRNVEAGTTVVGNPARLTLKR
jgi:sugar O-acyltransferase (sialic acid O-acetyltransferase NeuD family)